MSLRRPVPSARVPFPHVRRPWNALPAALLLAACTSGDRVALEELFDQPEEIDRNAVEILGTSDDLTRVVDLELAADGTVWLLNSAPPFFVSLDPDGRERETGGRRGGGPGEFGNPTALVRIGSGVWAWDAQRSALVRLSGPGGLGAGAGIESVPVRDDAGAPTRTASFSEQMLVGARAWVEPRGEGVMLARLQGTTWTNALRLWEAEFVAVEWTDGEAGVAPVFNAAEHLAAPGEEYPGAEFYLPFPLWSGCPDGTLVGYDPVRNALVQVDEGGAPLGSFDLPPAREIEATPERLFDDLLPQMLATAPSGEAPPIDELRAGFAEEFEQVRDQLGPVMPEYRELACSGGASGARAWLHLLDVGNSTVAGGARWLRMSLSDEPEFRVFRMPDGFRPLRFEDEVLWGVHHDALEVPHVARVRVP